MGSEGARRDLEEGPKCPELVQYLVDWTRALHGRSGVGFGVLAPLSHLELDAWARRMKVNPEPRDVAALMWLDAAMRDPDAVLKALRRNTEDERTTPRPQRGWFEGKRAA